MAKRFKYQEELILDQFSKQAIPFSEIPQHSDETAFQLMVEISGVTEQDVVLDLACGPGLVTFAFAKVARHVAGIDITPAMIERAKELQIKNNLTNISWQVGDVKALPYKDDSFSMVITRYSFHHLLDPKKVLMEMKRVCRTNGKIVIIDVAPLPEYVNGYNNVEKLRDPSHTRALTPDELLNITKEAGLVDIISKFYKLELELEKQLSASFPNEGDADKIREIFTKDLTRNKLGMGARKKENKIYITYPNLIIVGKKID